MKFKDLSTQNKLAMLPVVAAIATPLIAWKAYALTVLWTWFVLPQFGIQTPSIAIMAGLTLMATSLKSGGNIDDREVSDIIIKMIATGISAPAGMLALGYIVTLFM